MIRTEKLVTARRWRITFTVTGSGRFPVEMLHEDECFPVDVSAENAIRGDWSRRREVWLARYDATRAWRPTWERWRSFGWEVDE